MGLYPLDVPRQTPCLLLNRRPQAVARTVVRLVLSHYRSDNQAHSIPSGFHYQPTVRAPPSEKTALGPAFFAELNGGFPSNRLAVYGRANSPNLSRGL